MVCKKGFQYNLSEAVQLNVLYIENVNNDIYHVVVDLLILTYLMRKRVNGLQLPITPYQLCAILTYVLVVACYQVLMATENRGKWTLCVLIDTVLTVVALVFWFIIEYLDPAICSATPEYYCQLCAKRVPKLDHHCVWLNTCIGARNVHYFLMLIGALFVQEGMQLVVLATSSLWSAKWFSNVNKVSCLLTIHSLMCGIMFVGVSLLVGFHIYLQLIVRKTTYDWLLARSQW